MFVESYGRVSVQGSSFSPAIDALLNKGTNQLRALDSPRAARSSTRRASAGSAGWGTRPCSPGSGPTASAATTSSSPPTVSRSPTRSTGPGGGRSTSPRRTIATGPRAPPSTTTKSSTTAARWVIGARVSPMPRCPISTCSAPSSASSSQAPPAAVRGGGHGIQPHALGPHPPKIPWNDLGNGSIFNRTPTANRARSGGTPTR